MEEHANSLPVGGAADGGTDDLLIANGHNGLIALAGGQHLRERRERGSGRRFRNGGFEETDDSVEIIIMEIADAGAGHRKLLCFGGGQGTSVDDQTDTGVIRLSL